MTDLLPLVGAILALCLGPLLYRLARPAPALLAVLDGFTFVGISGLVVLEILPDSIERAGLWAIPVALLGFLGPAYTENLWKKLARPAHAVALFLGVSGILAHTFIDGVALVEAHLTFPVILHRLPVGLTLWWLLRPTYGRAFAIATLAILSLATVGGYWFGDRVLTRLSPLGIGLFEALVGGSLLHVLVHVTTPMLTDARSHRTASGVGALGAVALIYSLAGTHHHVPGAEHSHDEFGGLFLDLALTSAPALLLGYLAAGLVHGFLPRASVAWMGRGSRLGQSVRGLVFGLPLPVCSCGVVPLYRSLVKQGVPVAAAMTFLVATPELGLDAVLLSIPLLGPELTIARVVGAAVVALIIGYGVSSLAAPRETQPPVDPPASKEGSGFGPRLRRSLGMGLGELVDSTGPWIVLGLAVAAFAEPLLHEAGRFMGTPLEVVFFAFLGMPTYVCASGATPLVAVLVASGVSPGAGLAFLLTGPATNVTTFGILSRLHGRRLALIFGIGMLLLAIALGYAVNALMTTATPLAAVEEHHHASTLQSVCLAALGLLLLVSLLRQGPREFVGQILSGSGEHDHEHEHEHEHHDHSHPDPGEGDAVRAAPDACCP